MPLKSAKLIGFWTEIRVYRTGYGNLSIVMADPRAVFHKTT